MAPGVGKSYVSNICQVMEDRFDITDEEKAEIKAELRKHLKDLNYHMISEKGNEVVYNVYFVELSNGVNVYLKPNDNTGKQLLDLEILK